MIDKSIDSWVDRRVALMGDAAHAMYQPDRMARVRRLWMRGCSVPLLGCGDYEAGCAFDATVRTNFSARASQPGCRSVCIT